MHSVVRPLAAGSLVAAVLWALRGWVLHALEVVIVYARGLPLKRRKNPYLKGVFEPVDKEVTCSDLKIEGEMPSAMYGLYARNGPNPRLKPLGEYHWFDGDGMTHAVRISSKGCTYNNRYVRTRRVIQEERAGYQLFPKFGDANGPAYLLQMGLYWLRKMTGVVDISEGTGHGNTSLFYHANQLLALEEGDMPYALRVLCSGVVETLGRQSFKGQLKHEFTAHPKKDWKTGELFAFGYNVGKAPYCTVSTFDPKGNMLHDVPVTLRGPVMMHDCAMTEDYFIILDMPLFFEADRIVKNGTLPFHFDTSRPSRFGLLPRYADDESGIRWFDTPAQMIFHTANAWQEGPNIVKLVACCFDEFDLDLGKELKVAEVAPPVSESSLPHVFMMTFDLQSGKATRRRVAPAIGDFPTIPPRLTGHKTRYMYLSQMRPVPPGRPVCFVGICKIDLEAEDEASGMTGEILYPEGLEGGEAFFVPTDKPSKGEETVEDEGYLVTFLSSAHGESKMVVYDARTMATHPVASVSLPVRVPAGFHGLHINEKQLATQR